MSEVKKVQVALLIIAVSVDVFVACVACGSEQIRIGSAAALCISTVCSGILGISLYAGMALQEVLLKKYALYVSFFGLLAVGIFKLTEYAIKKYIERHTFLCKKVRISFSQLSFILSIYNNPVMADRDHSSTMSCVEAVFFALAMSLDGMFGGLGAGFTGNDIWSTVLGSFIVSFGAVLCGCTIGMQASKRWKADISWLGGVLFVLLAFQKII